MIFRLILSIFFCVLFALFTGFNIGNKCDIWFFAKTFHQVPVFVTVVVSFAAGLFCTIPVLVFRQDKKMTPEQARTLADKLEERNKKKLEAQIRRQNKIEQARKKAAEEIVKEDGVVQHNGN